MCKVLRYSIKEWKKINKYYLLYQLWGRGGGRELGELYCLLQLGKYAYMSAPGRVGSQAANGEPHCKENSEIL